MIPLATVRLAFRQPALKVAREIIACLYIDQWDRKSKPRYQI